MRTRFTRLNVSAECCVWAALTRAGLLREYKDDEIEALLAFVSMANASLSKPLDGRVLRKPLAYQEGTYKFEVTKGMVRFSAPLGSPSGHGATLRCSMGTEPQIEVDLTAMAQAEVEVYFHRLGIEDALTTDHFGPRTLHVSVQSKNPAIGVAWVGLIG